MEVGPTRKVLVRTKVKYWKRRGGQSKPAVGGWKYIAMTRGSDPKQTPFFLRLGAYLCVYFTEGKKLNAHQSAMQPSSGGATRGSLAKGGKNRSASIERRTTTVRHSRQNIWCMYVVYKIDSLVYALRRLAYAMIKILQNTPTS